MTNIYNYDFYKVRKEVKGVTEKKTMVYEIYLSTVKYVHKHSEGSYHNNAEYLTTQADLRNFFDGDEAALLRALGDLMNYWGIDTDNEVDPMRTGGFEEFPTLGHVCSYIERRVKDS
ncbi:hypothetical protein [Halobacillus naozhouensis]|uniref:Phage protein n=1 Tax=Halobacillus naozhouensis TaxID=554880 RepID=A0ABY8J4Q8_9BACI|nr:hypothetical protein [Halobacillus naozhouensis]WFT76418.1 hypothetical protein P9989_08665 [Halobacillus naozhouensis]